MWEEVFLHCILEMFCFISLWDYTGCLIIQIDAKSVSNTFKTLFIEAEAQTTTLFLKVFMIVAVTVSTIWKLFQYALFFSSCIKGKVTILNLADPDYF